MSEPIFAGRLDIYSVSGKKKLRSCGCEGNLSQLGSDEYFSFSLSVYAPRDRDYSWEEACVRVDGGEPWHWRRGRISASESVNFHIARHNMAACMTPGTHRAVWYFDGQARHTQLFVLTEDWSWASVFPIPSERQIAQHRNPRQLRSPYITGWFPIPAQTRYTEYTVEFKADYLPEGTYCSLGSWSLDLSELKKKYCSVRTDYDNTHGYAGFQLTGDGSPVSIMSCWDIYCRDARGNRHTISAERLYPAAAVGGGRFWGEGDGARCIAPFPWKAGHWYRMHLKALGSPEKTRLEQWVCDLKTGKDTLLCVFEIAVPNGAFQGDNAAFLENFLPETAAQLRSLELRNIRYREADTGKWRSVRQVTISSRDGLPNYEGSYSFGVTEGRIWMITSGVGGDWFSDGRGKKAETFYLP